MVQYLTRESFEGPSDMELNPRSEPMTDRDAQTWVNRQDAAVCPPASLQPPTKQAAELSSSETRPAWATQ